MSTWQTETVVATPAGTAFPHWAAPACIDVVLAGGTVTMQLQAADNSWVDIESLAEGRHLIEIANTPAFRVVPTGSAAFRITGI